MATAAKDEMSAQRRILDLQIVLRSPFSLQLPPFNANLKGRTRHRNVMVGWRKMADEGQGSSHGEGQLKESDVTLIFVHRVVR